MEIQNVKERCHTSRKELALATKQFRKASGQDKLNNVNGLLKNYQEEFDRLNKRAKFCENAFFNLYKALNEAPDPVPALLEQQQTTTKGGAPSELEKKLAEYEKEFEGLKNQDITIRELEHELASVQKALEENVETMVEEQVEQIEQKLNQRVHEAQQRQAEAERQTALAKQRLAETQANVDALQSEMLDLRQRDDPLSYQNEMEFSSQEALRLQQLEVENAELTKQLDLARVRVNDDTSAVQLDVLQAELEHKNVVITQLRDELINAQHRCSEYEERQTWTREQHDALQSKVQELAQELGSRPTIEQLDMLRAKAQGDSDMMEQVKGLQHDLDQAQTKREALEMQMVGMEKQLKLKQKRLDEQQVLINKLEEEVARRPRESPMLDKNAQLLSGVLTTSSGNESSTQDPEMLQIIREQRDRYRDRIKELESEKGQANDTIGRLKTSMKRLESTANQSFVGT